MCLEYHSFLQLCSVMWRTHRGKKQFWGHTKIRTHSWMNIRRCPPPQNTTSLLSTRRWCRWMSVDLDCDCGTSSNWILHIFGTPNANDVLLDWPYTYICCRITSLILDTNDDTNRIFSNKCQRSVVNKAASPKASLILLLLNK